MPVPLSLAVYFDPQPLSASLLGLEEFLEDRSPARNRIKADLAETIEGYFERQEGPQGKWEPLSPAYLAEKRRKGLDTRILHRTLDMRETIQISASDSGDQGLIEAISDLDYAATMHFGDIRDVFGNGTIAVIPARPFLDINSGKEEEYQDIYLNQIEQAWNANTFDF